MQHLGGVKTERQTQEYLDRNLAHWADKGFGVWVLRSPTSGEMVGRGGLRTLAVEDALEVEAGYGLRPKFWGQGLATEAALEFVRIARESLRLRTIVATTSADNGASKRVMGRVGLRFEREVDLYDMTLEMFRLQLDVPSNSRAQRTPFLGAADAAGRCTAER